MKSFIKCFIVLCLFQTAAYSAERIKVAEPLYYSLAINVLGLEYGNRPQTIKVENLYCTSAHLGHFLSTVCSSKIKNADGTITRANYFGELNSIGAANSTDLYLQMQMVKEYTPELVSQTNPGNGIHYEMKNIICTYTREDSHKIECSADKI